MELHDPAYAKRFYCTYEMLEENLLKVDKISTFMQETVASNCKTHAQIVILDRNCFYMIYMRT